jgi:hypothetical protein
MDLPERGPPRPAADVRKAVAAGGRPPSGTGAADPQESTKPAAGVPDGLSGHDRQVARILYLVASSSHHIGIIGRPLASGGDLAAGPVASRAWPGSPTLCAGMPRVVEGEDRIRPRVLPDERGWGAAGVLDLARVRELG